MKKPHYAWLIAIIACLIYLCSCGMTATGFSIFIPYIRDDINASNTAVNMVVTIRQGVSAFSLTLLPFVRKKIGSKNCLGFAMAIEALAFFVFSISKNIAMYYIGGFFLGLANGFGGIVCISLILSNWFDSKLAFVTGFACAGSGLASMLFPTFLTGIVEKASLSAAFITLAVFHIIVAAVVFILCKETPEAKGLTPYHEEGEKKAEKKKFGKGLPEKDFKAQLIGWFFMGICGGTGAVFNASLYRMAGFDPYIVSYITSVIGLTMIVGKLGYGAITEKFGSKASLFSALLSTVIGSTLNLFAEKQIMFTAFAGAIFIGYGLSASSVGVSTTPKEFSTEENFPKRLNAAQMVLMIGTVLSGVIGGIFSDIFGSYVPVFFVNGINAIIAIIFIIPKYKKIMQ